MSWIGWMLAAFLIGFLLALAVMQRRKHRTLRNRFSQVVVYRGRTYQEVLTIAGAEPTTVICRTDGSVWRVWREEGYAITLAFDRRDMCLGVVEEQG